MTLVGLRADAAILSQWTFETSIPATAGPFAAETGLVASTSFASSNTGGTYSNPAGNGSAESFSANGWDPGEYFQFTVNTSTQAGILLSWDQTRSSTGPAAFSLQYSTNGGTSFTQFFAYTVGTTSWSAGTASTTSSFSADLSSIASLDNNAGVVFRLVNAESAASTSTGTNRVDNFTVATIPEPAGALLGALGLLSILRRRR